MNYYIIRVMNDLEKHELMGIATSAIDLTPFKDEEGTKALDMKHIYIDINATMDDIL